jgi:hypothetical protein
MSKSAGFNLAGALAAPLAAPSPKPVHVQTSDEPSIEQKDESQSNVTPLSRREDPDRVDQGPQSNSRSTYDHASEEEEEELPSATSSAIAVRRSATVATIPKKTGRPPRKGGFVRKTLVLSHDLNEFVEDEWRTTRDAKGNRLTGFSALVEIALEEYRKKKLRRETR